MFCVGTMPTSAEEFAGTTETNPLPYRCFTSPPLRSVEPKVSYRNFTVGSMVKNVDLAANILSQPILNGAYLRQVLDGVRPTGSPFIAALNQDGKISLFCIVVHLIFSCCSFVCWQQGWPS